MRTIQDLSTEEKRKIFFESGRRCYNDIADDLNISFFTVKKVVRTQKRALKRYQKMETH